MKYPLTFLLFFSFLFFPLFSAQAVSFNKNRIISNSDLTNTKDFSVNRLATFLSHKGALGSLSFAVGGSIKSAAQIIYDAATTYSISPQYLIVRMQLEQGLVSSSKPSQYQLDWATGYGVCDSCTLEQAAKYKGFANQMNWGARGIRRYLDDLETKGQTISGWSVGKEKTTLDNISITPHNEATAALYTYTPWVGKLGGGRQDVGGNALFHKIFTSWFRALYPDGTVLQDSETGAVYVLRNGKKLLFASRSAFLSAHDSSDIIAASKVTLDAYPTGGTIRFADFSVLRTPDNTVYLYSKNQVRPLASDKVLHNIGYNPEEILPILSKDLQGIAIGKTIQDKDVYPTGALLQFKNTGGVVYVDENGFRHPIPSKDVLKAHFAKPRIIQKSSDYIKKFPLGDTLLLPEGTLVTSKKSKTIFIISGGKKRPFQNATVFNTLGYKWEKVISVDQKTLDVHPNGKIVTLD